MSKTDTKIEENAWTASDAARAFEYSTEEPYPDFWTQTSYAPIVDSLAPEIQVRVDSGSYQGDTFLILADGNRRGYVTFGWGSCSGCDALQCCSDWEGVANLRNRISTSIRWEDSADELRDWIVTHDWEGDWMWHKDRFHDFLIEAWEALGGEGEFPVDRPSDDW